MDLISPSNGLLSWQVGTAIVMMGYLAFMIYALVDLIRSDFREQHMKLIWVLLILSVPVVGTFLYLSMNRRIKYKLRRFNPDFSSHQTTTK
ncbi:PLD nuclease N-terminal domain-containing protein [Algoriphagus sp.]|uniref:PLD nuclease N-terminal domain-containing protein n=1 Tax=Algoriphagus sp. TaxID=1872435 RepID=UPI00328F1898